MTTFSQLVDDMVTETKRPDMIREFSSYLNQAIREVHFEPQTGNAILFKDNLTETLLTAGTESGFMWDVPNPAQFHGIAAVRYDSVWIDGQQPYVPEMTPGRGLAGMTRYYYRGGSRFAFAGYGGLNAKIAVAWWEYPRALKYKAVADRPAEWDDEAGWTYADAYDIDDSTRETARNLVSNWLLIRWKPVIEEALRAKVYKRLERTELARTCYSMYMSLRQGLITAESNHAGFID